VLRWLPIEAALSFDGGAIFAAPCSLVMACDMTNTRGLLTERECLSKAAEMEARAERCGSSRQAIDFINMARCWRVVAAQAAWQDTP
jgi:hypothetical protein